MLTTALEKESEQEYSEQFIRNMLPKLDLDALKQTALSLGVEFGFEVTRDFEKLSSENYKDLHEFLLEVLTFIYLLIYYLEKSFGWKYDMSRVWYL